MSRFYTPIKIAGYIFFILIISIILQMTLANILKVASISPNIFIIVVAISGFIIGKKTGMIFGFLSGLCMDILSFNLIGFHALIYMLIGYTNGNFKRWLFVDKYPISIALIGLSDIFSGFCNFIFLYLIRGRTSFIYYIKRVILSEGIYTLIIGIILFPILKIIFIKLNKMMTDYINSKR